MPWQGREASAIMSSCSRASLSSLIPAPFSCYHILTLTGVTLSDAALSLRKASFGWELPASLLPEVLRPLADPALHPDSFHKGLRLAAIDGVRFNLRNTAAINANTRKARSGKGGTPCAYPNLLCSVLVELGTHCPPAVSLSWQNDGELPLARDLIPAIPRSTLLLANRLYGSRPTCMEPTPCCMPKPWRAPPWK